MNVALVSILSAQYVAHWCNTSSWSVCTEVDKLDGKQVLRLRSGKVYNSTLKGRRKAACAVRLEKETETVTAMQTFFVFPFAVQMIFLIF